MTEHYEIDGIVHELTEEWVGYPMGICGYCIRPWPCRTVRDWEVRNVPA